MMNEKCGYAKCKCEDKICMNVESLVLSFSEKKTKEYTTKGLMDYMSERINNRYKNEKII